MRFSCAEDVKVVCSVGCNDEIVSTIVSEVGNDRKSRFGDGRKGRDLASENVAIRGDEDESNGRDGENTSRMSVS